MEPQHFESLFPADVRSSEVSQLVAYLKKGESCQLLGIPGVSRSTLLGLLAYNKPLREKHLGKEQAKYHFVIVNFSEMRKRSLEDVMKFLFLSLSESLRERGMQEEYVALNSLFKETLSFNDELILFQGLKQAIAYLAFEKQLTIVFLFDRFEEYIPSVTDEFFINLRSLRNRAKYQFSVIFSLTRPLEEIVDPSLLSEYHEYVAGHIVYLGLSDAPMTSFRVSYIEKVTGKIIPADVMQEVLAVTGGHGKLVKLSVESLLADGTDQKDLASFLLARRSIQTSLKEIWRSLSPAEQADLEAGTFDDHAIASYLEEVGLVRKGVIQIPLLAEFIAQLEKTMSPDDDHILYDDATNTITKGSVTLSDQLTSSEFRLLRYLIQHKDQVVEREELISVVWQEVKSTAGITDQAVDQLIFRLRRKIEEDANNPVHIHTVKGRGFKFTA